MLIYLHQAAKQGAERVVIEPLAGAARATYYVEGAPSDVSPPPKQLCPVMTAQAQMLGQQFVYPCEGRQLTIQTAIYPGRYGDIITFHLTYPAT